VRQEKSTELDAAVARARAETEGLLRTELDRIRLAEEAARLRAQLAEDRATDGELPVAIVFRLPPHSPRPPPPFHARTHSIYTHSPNTSCPYGHPWCVCSSRDEHAWFVGVRA
jgi:hypothetical protein